MMKSVCKKICLKASNQNTSANPLPASEGSMHILKNWRNFGLAFKTSLSDTPLGEEGPSRVVPARYQIQHGWLLAENEIK